MVKALMILPKKCSVVAWLNKEQAQVEAAVAQADCWVAFNHNQVALWLLKQAQVEAAWLNQRKAQVEAAVVVAVVGQQPPSKWLNTH